jgi:hypothetical protein
MRRAPLLAVLLLAPSGLLAAEEPTERAPELTSATYADLVAKIRPNRRECEWREPGWRPSFGAAVAEARAEKQPILLWAMNGHPLACT